jgi:hypothetical protein
MKFTPHRLKPMCLDELSFRTFLPLQISLYCAIANLRTVSFTYVLVSLAFRLLMNAKYAWQHLVAVAHWPLGMFSAADGFFFVWIYVCLGTSAFGQASKFILFQIYMFSIVNRSRDLSLQTRISRAIYQNITNISSSIIPHELTRMPASFLYANFGRSYRTMNLWVSGCVAYHWLHGSVSNESWGSGILKRLSRVATCDGMVLHAEGP